MTDVLPKRELGMLEYPKYKIIDVKRLNLPQDINFGRDIPQYEEVPQDVYSLVPSEVIETFKKRNDGISQFQYEENVFEAHVIGHQIKGLKAREYTTPKVFVERWLNEYFQRLERTVGKEVKKEFLFPELFTEYETFGSDIIHNIPRTSLTLLLEESARNINNSLRKVDMSIVSLSGKKPNKTLLGRLADVGVMVYEGRLNQ